MSVLDGVSHRYELMTHQRHEVHGVPLIARSIDTVGDRLIGRRMTDESQMEKARALHRFMSVHMPVPLSFSLNTSISSTWSGSTFG